jgi:putative acetyltransferase
MTKPTQRERIDALPIEERRTGDMTYWTIWDGDELEGCVAFKELNAQQVEGRHLRTSPAYQHNGIGSRLCEHVFEQARIRGFARVFLETGSTGAFVPARKLFAQFGFKECEPFADYLEDEYAVYMVKEL